MPRVIERTVFKFDELSEKAKEAARDWARDLACQDEWWDSVYEDAVTCGNLLGIEITWRNGRWLLYFSGFSSQGDGACFNGTYMMPHEDAIEGITQHAPQDATLRSFAERLTALQVNCRLTRDAKLSASITTSGYYHHSGTMSCTVSCSGSDNPFIDPDPTPDEETELLAIFRGFADWIYKQLEAEYDYLTSNKALDEQLADHKFDEDGSVI